VFTEPAQVLEVPGQRKEGEVQTGSGSAMEKRSLEQLQPDSREFSVVCSVACPVRVREFSEQLQLKIDNLPRVLSGTEFWPHLLEEIVIVPCIDSAGGERCDWKGGGPVLESDSSGLQVGVEGEASNDNLPGGAELVEFEVGEKAEDAGTPLNAYSPALGGLRYSDWVIG
jgi:hypothetical protein